MYVVLAYDGIIYQNPQLKQIYFIIHCRSSTFFCLFVNLDLANQKPSESLVLGKIHIIVES